MEHALTNTDGSVALDPTTAEETLRLAVRLQEEAKTHLSLTDVGQIAREAGIEQRFVDEALHILRTPAAEAQRTRSSPKMYVGAAIALAAYLFANLIVNSSAFGENLFTLVAKTNLLAYALALGFGACFALGRVLPSGRRMATYAMSLVVAMPVLIRSLTDYSWDLSFGLHTTLAILMLVVSGVLGFGLGHFRRGRSGSDGRPY